MNVNLTLHRDKVLIAAGVGNASAFSVSIAVYVLTVATFIQKCNPSFVDWYVLIICSLAICLTFLFNILIFRLHFNPRMYNRILADLSVLDGASPWHKNKAERDRYRKMTASTLSIGE